MDARQQTAIRIAGRDVRIDRFCELVAHGVLGLHAVQGFAVRGVGLAADGMTDAGLGHQVAFVGGVDKRAAGENAARLHDDGRDPSAFLADAAAQVKSLADNHRHAGLGEHLAEHVLGHVRLEGPHRVGVDGRLLPVTVALGGFLFPGLGPRVVAEDALVELAGDAADGRLVADVGGAEPPDVSPPKWRPGSIKTTLRPMRAVWMAAAMPPVVPP